MQPLKYIALDRASGRESSLPGSVLHPAYEALVRPSVKKLGTSPAFQTMCLFQQDLDGSWKVVYLDQEEQGQAAIEFPRQMVRQWAMSNLVRPEHSSRQQW